MTRAIPSTPLLPAAYVERLTSATKYLRLLRQSAWLSFAHEDERPHMKDALSSALDDLAELTTFPIRLYVLPDMLEKLADLAGASPMYEFKSKDRSQAIFYRDAGSSPANWTFLY